MSKNPYEEAHGLLREQSEIVEKINALTARNVELTAKIESLIASAQGAQSIGKYRLITQRKTRETRTVIIDKIKEYSPELLFKAGKYTIPAVDVEWTDEKKRAYLESYNYGRHYQIGLSELDVAVGGKKNSAPYVDIDIKETLTYSVEKTGE